jgi:hypothetical protein
MAVAITPPSREPAKPNGLYMIFAVVLDCFGIKAPFAAVWQQLVVGGEMPPTGVCQTARRGKASSDGATDADEGDSFRD